MTPRLCSPTTTRPGSKARLKTSSALRGSASPHMKTSKAAKPFSGQVWTLMWLSASTATQKDEKGRKAFSGRGGAAEGASRQHRHAGNAAAVLELVQVNMQQGCARLIHRIDQSGFDTLAIIQSLGFPKVDDHMAARI